MAADDEWTAWDAFHLMRRALDRALDVSLQDGASVSSVEYETLIALGRSPERRLRVTELARALGWEKSRVSHLIGRMEKRGFIERSPCETDARGAWVTATPNGRRAALQAMRGHNAALDRYVFDALSTEETLELGRLSSKMLAAIGTTDVPGVPDARGALAAAKAPGTSGDPAAPGALAP